jgi:hypothetical protein
MEWESGEGARRKQEEKERRWGETS